MDTNATRALIEYLGFMRQMGFEGLYLPANPFTQPMPVDDHRPRVAGEASTPVESSNKMESRPVAVPHLKPLDCEGGALLVSPVTQHGAREVRNKIAAIHETQPEARMRHMFQCFVQCQACGLGVTRRRFVFGEGPCGASVMFVGEGPGREEDRQGRPFVGNAGELLTKMIAAMGMTRKEVFVGNVVKCRPPMNRAPLPDEIAACSAMLEEQIRCVSPKVIVSLGATALRFFLGTDVSMTRRRGRFLNYQGIPVMPTFHPAYMLRQPSSKRLVWEDLQKVMAHLNPPKV